MTGPPKPFQVRGVSLVMAKSLQQWMAEDVAPVQDRSMAWLSEQHFFRDPVRPTFSDPSYFFSPADGVILYQKVVDPDESIVDIKGVSYSLQDALRDDAFDKRSLVIGIFMTFFDVHINRIPYPGRLSYRMLEPIDTFNHPMLGMEKSILGELRAPSGGEMYMRQNQRMLNRVDCTELGTSYFLLQIADYDVDSVMPFELSQNEPCYQGERFSMIRYGSQVDLIIPLIEGRELVLVQEDGVHVEAGLDPLVRLTP